MYIKHYKDFKLLGKDKIYIVCPLGCSLPKEEIQRIENEQFVSFKLARQTIDTALTSLPKKKFSFWDRAKCRNTLRRTSPGVKKLLKRYPNLIKVRRYVDPKSDEKRRTVEIEIES